jgi:plasmid maintenance system antidote protein VapI
MTQAELARRMARPLKTISEIVNGHAAITADTAIQLERVLGIPAALWNGLEAQYRGRLAQERAEAELGEYIDWARQFPLAALAKHGLIESSRATGATAQQLMGFFGVSSPEGWQQHWGQAVASYRLGRAGIISSPALTAWLRWAELEADRIEVDEYERERFLEVLRVSRGLSRQALFQTAIERLADAFASAGVALVVLPSLPGAPASGASRWYRNRGLITLSMRYLSDDQFWHSVYHEAGHLVSGRRGRAVLEDLEYVLDIDDEKAANEFARELLIPRADLKALVATGKVNRQSVKAFARSQGIAPGIVVGRLQRDDIIAKSQMNDLKQRLEHIRT